MTDVFISYTQRGVIDKKWVEKFVQNLKDRYRSTYDFDISIWFYTGNYYGVGDRFRREVIVAETNCKIFMAILEPEYMQSTETVKEMHDYLSVPESPKNIIKVIAKRGINEDINQVVAYDLVRAYICNDSNQLLNDNTDEYRTVILEIVNGIYRLKKQFDFEISFKQLNSHNYNINIYTALGNGRILNSNRDQLQLQLNETLKHADFTKENSFRTLPDQFQMISFSYESVLEMVHANNNDSQMLIKNMLDLSDIVIIPVQFEDEGQVEKYINEIKPQLELIKKAVVNRLDTLQVYFLLNVPKVMYNVPMFNDAFNNAAINGMKNVTIYKDRAITDFIDLIVENIRQKTNLRQIPEDVFDKNIYIIESSIASISKERNLSEEEKQNRKAFREAILEKKFGLIPFLEQDNLSEAAKKHVDNLNSSSGVIIYKGAEENKSWWLVHESEIFKALLALKKTKTKKAIYIDPIEPERSPGSYGFYNYEVIVEETELNQFLSNIK